MRSILVVLFSAGYLMSAPSKSSPDISDMLMHHVSDQKEWSILPAVPPIPIHDLKIGSLTIPVTMHVIMLVIATASLTIVFCMAFSGNRTCPGKLGLAIEPIVLFIRDSLIYPVMGEELGQKWLPFFLTLFFFLLTSNLMGLIPLFGASTGNLSVTAALALMILVAIIAHGMKSNGVIGFFKNMIPAGVPLPIGILLLMVEIPGLFIKCSVLAIRLFANMIAGHFVILSLLLLIFIIHPVASVISVPLALFINLLELLVAVIQALVFTILSAIFISTSSSHH
jgi:F-type H+-transporting ATPase subunit a